MTPGQSESNVLDRVIASYEWMLGASSVLLGRKLSGENDQDIHAWNIAKFNLEELKNLRKRLEIGPVYIDGIIADRPDVSPEPAEPPPVEARECARPPRKSPL